MTDAIPLKRIGRTDLRVPELGMGVAHLGGMYGFVPTEQSRATLQAAWDGGVRFYDTAPWYGRGLSEHRLGDFLIDKPRDEVIVTTKIGRCLVRPADPAGFDRAPWPGGLNFDIRFSYSYDAVMRSYEDSLQRLATDRIDALLIHDPDPVVHGEHFATRMHELETGGIRALEELKRTGQIRAIGMGINTEAALTEVVPRVPLDFLIIAMPYTLLDQSALSTMAWLQDKGTSIVIGAPYASGILVTGPVPGARYAYQPASEAVLEKTRRIAAVCAAHGTSLPAAALRFCLAHPAVAAIIPGSARPEEVTATLGTYATPVPAALWQELKSTGLIDAASPVPEA
ncbi:MAG: aldo/keto reductase [Rubellimicrobium sp.]|nr:aldo/keto reductase [Rubellimicrobium sp.]